MSEKEKKELLLLPSKGSEGVIQAARQIGEHELANAQEQLDDEFRKGYIGRGYYLCTGDEITRRVALKVLKYLQQ